VLMMDADLSHDPAAVPPMMEKLAGCDMVIGSRYAPGGRLEGWSLPRRMLSRWGNCYARAVTGMPFRDCTAGFLLLRRRVVEQLLTVRMEMAGYAFLMELKHRVWRWNFTVAEVPVVFRDRSRGHSKISNNIIREGILAPWILR
jgi:dolichol-phosphate mannosyltransferase